MRRLVSVARLEVERERCGFYINMKHLGIFLLFLCLGLSSQRSMPQDDYYVGAVVEYIVDRNVTANIINYARLIQEAAEQNADIVVFPELTLTNGTTSFVVPLYGALRQYSIPALNPALYDEFMVGISAAARENEIYVVINGRELMDCTAQDTGEYCPEPKEYVFNTNVVFDRNGAVINRYRKINLFGEYTHTPALRPDLGVFSTDFGVTFGHFICFDLMFQVPAVQVVQKENIKNIIFPTMWFSEMPYLTAVQIQEAYAYTLDVNFLGAGANNVNVGSAGSGIFSGKAGALISIMPGVPTTRVLVAKVPKVPGLVTETYPGPIYDNPSDHDNLRLITDPSLASHVSRPLVQGFQEFTLVDKDVSCTFRVRLSQRDGSTLVRYRAFVQDGTNTYARRELGVTACLIVACKTDDIKSCPYRYRAGAFSGVRSFSGVTTGGTRVCSVYACTGDTRDTCAIRFPTYIENTTAIFEELTIIGTMPTPVVIPEVDADDSIVYPVSMTVSIMPLETKEYSYSTTKNSNITVHTLTLKNQTAELYTFALWGRVFSTDGLVEDSPLEDQTPDSSVVHLLSRVLLVSIVALLCNSQL